MSLKGWIRPLILTFGLHLAGVWSLVTQAPENWRGWLLRRYICHHASLQMCAIVVKNDERWGTKVELPMEFFNAELITMLMNKYKS